MSNATDAELLRRALGAPRRLIPGFEERLDRLGGLNGLWRAGDQSLCDLLDTRLFRRTQALFQLCQRWVEPPDLPPRIDGPQDVVDYLAPRLRSTSVESFWVVFLNARGRPSGVQRVSEGTLTACLVHPREVFASAIQARASTLIGVHNHPSGDVEPSPEDFALTDRLTSAGELLGIPFLDHIVVAGTRFRSLGWEACGSPRSVEWSAEGFDLGESSQKNQG